MRTLTRRTTTLCLMAALLAGAVAAAGCGGGHRTFYNDQYGFSITVDPRFAQWENATVDTGGAFKVAFADRGGAQAGGRYLDAIVIAVVDLGREYTPAEAASMATTLQGMSSALAASLGSGAQTAAAQPATVNGIPGVVVPFSVTVAGTPVLGWDYILLHGRYVYTIATMAAASTWERDKPAFQAAIESFAVKGASAVPSPLPTASPAPAATGAPTSYPSTAPSNAVPLPTVTPTHKPRPRPNPTTAP